LIELSKLPEHLRALKSEDWAKLFDLLKESSSVKQFGELKGMEKLQQENSTFPYYINAAVVDKFLKVVRELDIVPDFDWPGWKEGKEILNDEMQDYEKLDEVTLCKLFTVIIRSDRFNEGYLAGSFNDGTVQKIIGALKNKVLAK
jgi:hypothetical protein